ncbi:MAG TPA: polyprenyl synthetase family protein [Anaerolineae bacterium]|nr:polyprenyl synthetase family protein [Anaerolineae bacterium]
MDHQAFAERYLPLVNASLQALIRQEGQARDRFYGMMQYHLGWVDEGLTPVSANPGKRLRPLLCLLACYASGGDPADALPAAAALELVHSFSLVHDDIEDGSRLRRGRPAVWDVWGEAQAINVGDGLFALAHLAILRLSGGSVPAERTLAAARALDDACLALCEGQYLDMRFEGQAEVGVEQYLEMIGLKTAALLAASARIGVLVATEDAGTAAALHGFGESLGLAFQIQDDVLGIWGEEDVTGKSSSTDLRDKKKTLPILHALAHDAGGAGSQRLSSLLQKVGLLDDEECREALAILERAQSRQHAEEMAGHYLRLALGRLGEAGLPPAGVEPLAGLATSLLRRRS